MKKLLTLFSALVFTTTGVNNVFDNHRIEKTANKIKELHVLWDSLSDVGALTGAVSSFLADHKVLTAGKLPLGMPFIKIGRFQRDWLWAKF